MGLSTSHWNRGKVTTDIVGNDTASAVALTPDGKIVVVGSSTAGNAQVFSVARYNTDGTLDITFSGDGKTFTALGTNNYAQGMAVAVQADGKSSPAESTRMRLVILILVWFAIGPMVHSTRPLTAPEGC